MKRIVNNCRATVLIGLVALLMACGSGPAVAKDTAGEGAAPLAPEPVHVRKAKLVSELLSQHHYRSQVIDDRLSKTVFDAYINTLDRDRYYFLASDIEGLQNYRDRLDESFISGDLTPAYRIFARYQKRVEERAEYALQTLAEGLEFDDEERIELDRSEAEWPADHAAMDAAWDKRIKHDAITLRLADQEWDRIEEILENRYQRLARTALNHTAEDVFEVYMNAWANIFDPHTSYMSPRLSEDFDIHMRLSLEGIGALLRSENDMTEVVELITGGPAASNGQLQPGDRIIGVGQGEDGEIIDVVGMPLTDVVDKIRGPKESIVRLQVLSASGDPAPRLIQLTRNEVQLEEQAAQAQVIETGSGEDTRQIGVIKIPTFYMDYVAADAGEKDYRSTTRDVRRLLGELQEQDIDGLVIDLRGNGGGSLREATELTGLFLPGAPVVQVRRSSGEVEVLADQSKGLVYAGPLGVLVDGFSASASEIFAGAIQDHGRGVIVGQQTFGKGSVQTLVDLDHFGFRSEDPAGRLKLTIAQFYRVSGGSTQKRGIIPDIPLPARISGDKFGENSIDNALPWDEIKPVKHARNERLTKLLPALQQRHLERSTGDAAFQALMAEYEHLQRVQQRTDAPLSEQRRRAERNELQEQQLVLVNRRREAYGLPKLDSVDDHDMDEIPDTLLKSTAAIVADLYAARDVEKGEGPRWAQTKAAKN